MSGTSRRTVVRTEVVNGVVTNATISVDDGPVEAVAPDVALDFTRDMDDVVRRAFELVNRVRERVRR